MEDRQSKPDEGDSGRNDNVRRGGGNALSGTGSSDIGTGQAATARGRGRDARAALG
jgi:hypothetical protein